MSSYFFAFDLQNPQTWSFLQRNFVVNKTHIPFSAIGTDHAIEHENRVMKVMKVIGGIKGIANQSSALEKHFLVASDMNKVIGEFQDTLGVGYQSRKEHYQFTGDTNARIARNVKKLSEVFTTHDVNFHEEDRIFNNITKAVFPENLSAQFLAVEEEGKKLLTKFETERLWGTESTWVPLKRRKLPTFNATVATTKVKLKDKIVTLKEERRLLTRFLIAYKERPEVDLPSHIGRYEFSVVPRSMFHSDGSMSFASDKSSLMHEIEKITKGDSSCDEDSVGDAEQDRALHRVIMFDGMGVVNKLKKSDAIRTCKDLADVFVQRILGESNNYQVVAMIFDRYMVSSLKSKTRN